MAGASWQCAQPIPTPLPGCLSLSLRDHQAMFTGRGVSIPRFDARLMCEGAGKSDLHVCGLTIYEVLVPGAYTLVGFRVTSKAAVNRKTEEP